VSDWSEEDRARFLHESMERWHRNRRDREVAAPSDLEMIKGLAVAALVAYLTVCAVVLFVCWLS
jgi:hypothetical protein